MTERAPGLILNLGDGEKIELNYKNTKIYTFLGQTAVNDTLFENSSANHAFVQTGLNEQNQPTGMYLFERFQPVYRTIADFAIQHNFTQHLNDRTLPAGDLNAYMREVDREEEKFAKKLEAVRPSDF